MLTNNRNLIKQITDKTGSQAVTLSTVTRHDRETYFVFDGHYADRQLVLCGL